LYGPTLPQVIGHTPEAFADRANHRLNCWRLRERRLNFLRLCVRHLRNFGPSNPKRLRPEEPNLCVMVALVANYQSRAVWAVNVHVCPFVNRNP
jgi:hypothetical protein